MSLKAELGPQLPYLRRYTRALTGSQTLGDVAVRDVLEALLASPEVFNQAASPRQELYRVFHLLWAGPSDFCTGRGMVTNLSIHTRQSLLLTAIEDFTINQAAEILGSTAADVAAELDAAREAIANCLHSQVLIIEDEAVIALHLNSIVESLGHSVTGIARSRSEAVSLAAEFPPELILADISLADGSSGIDAVRDIMALLDVPVIFITAFPERLLTGERPEPTWLVAKPFNPETVAATIGQALFFHREYAALAATPAGTSDDAAPKPRENFATPEDLLADPALGDDDKQALLTEWDSEIEGRLNAEAEGMGSSDPLTASKEGKLADEARKVKSALTTISARISDSG